MYYYTIIPVGQHVHHTKRRHDEVFWLKFRFWHHNQVVGFGGVGFIEVGDVGLRGQHFRQDVVHHLGGDRSRDNCEHAH